ncbi:MAG: Rieske 2Fe-2S domain-containing protein [Actinomycetota bacterium]
MPSEFNFFQHWYPLSPIEDLDPTRPTTAKLLGLRVVIWKPKTSETYRVFLDECPHRLAPLSEGRIDEQTGQLMCSYHGWQFDAEGHCTRIPQAENPQLILQNKTLCAVALPCRQENDLLWVWPDRHSVALAATVPLPLSPQIDAAKGFVWSSYLRDLEYDWQTLIENLADPSHVPFAHHGVQGNRKQGQPMPLKIVQSTPDLIEAKVQRDPPTTHTLKTTVFFKPPCHLEYIISFGSDRQVGFVFYCIPVAPGKCRLVGQFPLNFAKTFHRFMPRWLDHIRTRNLVLEGDMILLHQQEHFFKQKQQKESWETAYKLPTSADRLVIEFRRWFDRYAGGKLPWEEVGLAEVETAAICEERQFLLDRYRQHTQHCHSCRTTLKRVQGLQRVLLTYVAVAVPTVAVMPDALRFKLGLPMMAVALSSLGIYSWLKLWLEPKFYFVDYIHAEK